MQSWVVIAALVTSVAFAGGAKDVAAGRGKRRAVLTSTQPVLYVPGWIDYTGTTDVTKALQNFVNQVPNGRLLLFHKNGRYRVEGTIFVTDKTLTFEGQNATIFATSRGSLERSQWWISGGGGIVFRHLTVRGANPDAGLGDDAYNPKYEKQHGFRIEGVQGIELDHVTVTDVYGDFVYIARDLSWIPSTDVWIHDSTFRRNGRQGISVIAAQNVVIEHNTFSDTRRGTIDLEPNGPNQSDSDIFVLNNSVGSGRLMFVAAHGKGPVDDVVISGNQLHKHTMTIDDLPPKGQRRSNWIVTDNTSDTTAHYRPIRFIDTDGILVTGNTQPVSDEQPGVELTDACGARISANDFGTGKVRAYGPTCSAPLQVPTEPVIFGLE